MFPLLNKDGPNRLELFQIWLNLPRARKMAQPHFKMLWAEDTPTRLVPTEAGGAPGTSTRVTVIAGRGFLPAEAEAGVPAPPPHSYAHEVDASDVGIVTLTIGAGARYTLPPARRGSETRRKVFFYKGKELSVAGRAFGGHMGIELRADLPVELAASGGGDVEVLLLQGVPIGEPVVQHGPFVMTSREEIMQAFADYQKDEFGDWPHDDDAPVHPRDRGRFAQHGDGKFEERPWPESCAK